MSLSLLLQLGQYTIFAKFVDPIISIGITLCFLYHSLIELKHSILELASSTPEYELRESILISIDKKLRSREIETYVLRLAKVGNQLIVEVDIVILPNSELDTIQKQDLLRGQLNQDIKRKIKTYSLWLNVNFIGDIKWAYVNDKAIN